MKMAPPTADYGSPAGKPPRTTNLWVWIVVGSVLVVGCGGALLLSVILFPVFMNIRATAARTACIGNVRRISVAALQYAGDFDDRLPAGAAWQNRLERYIERPRVFTCPTVRRQGGRDNGYAVNSLVAGGSLKELESPDKTIWAFETGILADNASEDPNRTPFPNRHGNGRVEGYLDGRATFVRDSPR